MNKPRIFFVIAALTLVLGRTVWGNDVAGHTITFDFQEINEIELTGSPALTINAAIAGENPDDATDSASTYAVTTNGTNKRIAASIDTAMPAHADLRINMPAPSASGTSKEYVLLSTSATDAVTGISHAAQGNIPINYKLSASARAGVLSGIAKTITLTLSD